MLVLNYGDLLLRDKKYNDLLNFSQFITLGLKKLILIIFSLNERALSPKKVTFDNEAP